MVNVQEKANEDQRQLVIRQNRLGFRVVVSAFLNVSEGLTGEVRHSL